MVHTFQERIKFLLSSMCVNTMREIKRVLETIVAGDPETEGTTPAAVAVPVVIIIVIVIAVIIGVIIYIVRRRRRNRYKTNRYSTTVHDTHALHLSYSCYYYSDRPTNHTFEYLCSMV